MGGACEIWAHISKLIWRPERTISYSTLCTFILFSLLNVLEMMNTVIYVLCVTHLHLVFSILSVVC